MVSSIENGISRAADVAGFIPAVSTVTGLMRAIYGLAKMIFNTIRSAMTDDSDTKKKFQKEIDSAKVHITLGCVEMIPGAKLVGTIFLGLFIFDMIYN